MDITTQIGYSVLGLVLGSVILVCILYLIEYINHKKWQRRETKEFLEWKKRTDEQMERIKDWK